MWCGCCWTKKRINETRPGIIAPSLSPTPKTFREFTRLPLDLQRNIATYCNRTHELRSTCRALRESVPARPPRRTVPRDNFGFALYNRWIDGPWESELALSTIMLDLSRHMDVKIFQHPQQLIHHMMMNDAHPQTIRHVGHMMTGRCVGVVAFLPIHSEYNSVYHDIYRYRTSFDYV